MTQLPKGWALATVGEVSEPPQYGWTTKASESGQVKFLRTTDITKGPIQWDTVPFCSESPGDLSKFQLTEGDIVVSRAGSVGASALIVGEPPLAAFASYLIRFRPSRSFDERYLAFFLHSPAYWQEIADSAAGIALQNVNAKKLAAIALPVAPLAEQERIVTAIEEAFSKLDAGEAGLRTVRQLLKRMRDAILTAAVTGRLVPQDPTDTPAAKLLADLGVEAAESEGVPELPPSWSWAELGVIAEVVGGVTKDSKRQSDPSFVEVPYLRVANVQRGFLDLETITTIRVAPEKAAQLELQPGDVLFNEGGDRDKLGRGWVWDGQIASCIHQNHVFRARLFDRVEPKLVSIWGNTFGRGWFEGRGKQTTNLASLNLKTLKAFPVPIAPVEEQPRILAEVERQMSFLDACERAVDVGLARASGLRRSVLKAAFEGRLVPQDPSDEPATVLLERIRAERSVQPVAKRRVRQTA